MAWRVWHEGAAMRLHGVDGQPPLRSRLVAIRVLAGWVEDAAEERRAEGVQMIGADKQGFTGVRRLRCGWTGGGWRAGRLTRCTLCRPGTRWDARSRRRF